MEKPIVYIPTNFTDAGKVFGLFELRNIIEAVCLCVPVLLVLIPISPFNVTGTIILCASIITPIGGFALSGIQDYSLITFLLIYRKFKRNKRIITYRGLKWLNKK